MPRTSAGLLMYRFRNGAPEILLVHPGGPFWRNKDEGAWSIPKGEPAEGEDLLDVARREFREELGSDAADGPFRPLSPVKQKGGKVVHAWSCEGDLDTTQFRSSTFSIEWPPRSGRRMEVPEIDRAGFFDLPTARLKINPAQAAFLDELEAQIGARRPAQA